MKAIPLAVTTAALFALGAIAADAKDKAAKAPKLNKQRQHVIATYDRNNNGAIDANEVAAIQKALATDPALKPFDKNNDGTLDEIEVSSINPEPKKKKK